MAVPPRDAVNSGGAAVLPASDVAKNSTLVVADVTGDASVQKEEGDGSSLFDAALQHVGDPLVETHSPEDPYAVFVAPLAKGEDSTPSSELWHAALGAAVNATDAGAVSDGARVLLAGRQNSSADGIVVRQNASADSHASIPRTDDSDDADDEGDDDDANEEPDTPAEQAWRGAVSSVANFSAASMQSLSIPSRTLLSGSVP